MTACRQVEDSQTQPREVESYQDKTGCRHMENGQEETDEATLLDRDA